MKEAEYKENWVNRRVAIAEMRKHFSSLNIRFRWVDTSGANWQGYSGYIVAEKANGKKDECNQEIYEEISRIVSESPYLEDGINLVGGKGCIAMCSFRKSDVEKFISGLTGASGKMYTVKLSSINKNYSFKYPDFNEARTEYNYLIKEYRNCAYVVMEDETGKTIFTNADQCEKKHMELEYNGF
jgi:hypothetical protein